MVNVKGVDIEFLGHSGFLIRHNGKRIAIDPYNVSKNIEPVDFILITHSHYDHCSIKDIVHLSKKGTMVAIPADAQSKITKVEDIEMHIVEVGSTCEEGGIKFETIPAYNVDKDAHPKEEGWMGYLIKINGVVIYHAGDTDKIPEMNKLTGYGKHDVEFVALLPVSGVYTMNVDEAVEAASLLNPDLVIPMHYGAGVVGSNEDAQDFVKRCKEIGLNALILEKI